eukprot:327461-Chlamydomonas_euryale.AAC.1
MRRQHVLHLVLEGTAVQGTAGNAGETEELQIRGELRTSKVEGHDTSREAKRKCGCDKGLQVKVWTWTRVWNWTWVRQRGGVDGGRIQAHVAEQRWHCFGSRTSHTLNNRQCLHLGLTRPHLQSHMAHILDSLPPVSCTALAHTLNLPRTSWTYPHPSPNLGLPTAHTLDRPLPPLQPAPG